MSTARGPLPSGALVALVLSTLVFFPGLAAGAVEPRDGPDGPAALYAARCASCHGARGAGGNASPLDATGHAWHHPDGQLFLWLKLGRMGPAARMPGFGGELTPEELCSLIRLMKSWWTAEQGDSQEKLNAGFGGENPC